MNQSTNQPIKQSTNYKYPLRLGDNALILGQRLSEWCGHGPVLEQDIAMTNIALDLMGQARSWLQYAGQLEGKGQSEDDLAFLRDERAFHNVLLVEQPNTDFAYTIVRQFLFDVFNFYLHEALVESQDEKIAAIAAKSLKEITYHLRYSSEWMIRLGDGTEESHEKMQMALNDLWEFSGELITADELDLEMQHAGIGPDLKKIAEQYHQKVNTILQEATLDLPGGVWFQNGGKQGIHTEYLGPLLAEMQFLPRAYPGANW